MGGAESSASGIGGKAGASSSVEGGGGRLGASTSVSSAGSGSVMKEDSSEKVGDGMGFSSFSSSTTGSVAGAGASSSDAPLPNLLSYPPVATFRTCTTLTPVSRAMAALFGLAWPSNCLIWSKVSWSIETVCLLPEAEVAANLFLKA